MAVRPKTLNLDAAKRALEASVLTYGDSDCIRSLFRARNSRRSLSAVAKPSGCCTFWDLSRHGAEATVELASDVWSDIKETNLATQQILCCDYSAALGMIQNKGSTRKTRHIELKACLLQQCNARPEVRLTV